MIEANALVEIDYTGATVLAELIRLLRDRGVDVAVARLEFVRAQLSFARLGLFELIGRDHVFRSVQEAIDALARAGPMLTVLAEARILSLTKWRYAASKPLNRRRAPERRRHLASLILSPRVGPMADIPIGVVTISDRASRGVYEDKGGPGIEAALKDLLATPWRPERRVVPDERPAIEAALIALADEARCPLILTTGGTGPAPRDVTPEATEAVCDRMLPGFGELMRLKSLAEVPTAILSRQVAGTRGSSLIINLPGKPAAIRTCLDAVFAAVPYCIDLIGGARLETNPKFCTAFRPKA